MKTSHRDVKRLAFVLTAGGARAAYQVGVIRHIAENCPHLQPTILCGISAGSINAAYFAQGSPFERAAHQAYTLWSGLHYNDIFRTSVGSLVGMSTRLMNDIFLAKLSRKILFRSLFDATPLYLTLSKHINMTRVWKAIHSGQVEGFSVSTTNYQEENTHIFFDAFRPIPDWRHGSKRGIRATLRLRHIMASCAIPLLFQPVQIGDASYGDGSLLFNSPFSPALRMGATHAIAIATSQPTALKQKKNRISRSTVGSVAGSDSIFLDSVEADFDNLMRFNKYADRVEEIRPVQALLFQPSQDPGEIARDFVDFLPFTLRQIFRAGSMSPGELGGLLSYLLFDPAYLKRLVELGRIDAENQHDALENFAKS